MWQRQDLMTPRGLGLASAGPGPAHWSLSPVAVCRSRLVIPPQHRRRRGGAFVTQDGYSSPSSSFVHSGHIGQNIHVHPTRSSAPPAQLKEFQMPAPQAVEATRRLAFTQVLRRRRVPLTSGRLSGQNQMISKRFEVRCGPSPCKYNLHSPNIPRKNVSIYIDLPCAGDNVLYHVYRDSRQMRSAVTRPLATIIL